MLEVPDRSLGFTFGLAEYIADYRAEAERLVDGAWKLECRQSFREPGHESWEALDAGDWGEAISLIARDEERYATSARQAPQPFRRVRIAQRPYSQYLAWELLVLKIRANAGEKIHILDATEDHRNVVDSPELVIFSDDLMYEVLYDESGTGIGAVRFDFPGAAKSALAKVREMFDNGTDISIYLDRFPASVPAA